MANSNLRDRSKIVSPTTPTSSPTSARRQVRRAITELSPPGKVNLRNIQHQPVHHPHDYRHRVHHRHYHRKHSSQDVRHAAVTDPTRLTRHSFDMGRSSISQQGLGMSPVPSRRTSVLMSKSDDSGPKTGAAELRVHKEKQLQEAKRRADYRADGLKESLVNLHDFAADATKQLDETYYSVLEKMDALQHTIIALKDLADTSHDIYGTFEKESRDLEHEIVSQIGALGRFEEQQSKIESLQSQIIGGRERIGILSQRIDVVRKRVEGWEEADREWQEKTRKKMKLVWSTIMVLVLVLVLLIIAMKSSISDTTNSANHTVDLLSNKGSIKKVPNTSKPFIPLGAKDQFGSNLQLGDDVHFTTSKDSIATLQETLDRRRRMVDGERLRILDEL